MNDKDLTTKTFLVSRLVDSLQLVDDLGDAPAARLFARHHRQARELMGRYGGMELGRAHGLLVLFRQPLDAVRYALEYHAATSQISREMLAAAPEGAPSLRARVAIDQGQLVLRREAGGELGRDVEAMGISGLLVHQLSRIALPCQTLLTRAAARVACRATVREAALPADVRWIEHGRFQVDGTDHPVELVEVGRTGIAPLMPPAIPRKVRPSSREKVRVVSYASA